MFTPLETEEITDPSMKVPPKRKGNIPPPGWDCRVLALNESPSEKEGKSQPAGAEAAAANLPQ